MLLLAVMIAAVLTGRYPRPGIIPPALLRTDALALRLVMELRLPRVLAAAMLGAALAAAGVVMQMLFANPLVEPGLVGVSQGAAFGAALAILLAGQRPAVIQLSAALFAIGGLVLTYRIARRLRFGGWILRLVLSGIAVSALLSSGVGIIKFLADPLDQLPEVTFWMLGGLWNVTWREVLRISAPVGLGIGYVYMRRYRLNILSLQDRVSFSLGARPDRERLFLLLGATVATASVISVAGIIGWVGLLVPHAARRIFRADAMVAMPASILLGAIFTVLADTLGRSLVAGEIPLGIITSLVGATGFIGLLMTHNVRMER
ncbi:MAG: iron ABC transporter permease [Spirochaetaceae bacterium]|nr:MAG: iron ABC transporter permease [Spirochaetaceae bacterium]